MAKTTETDTQATEAGAEAAAETTSAPIVEGDWVRATADLYVGHVKAASAGDLVHLETVKNNGWDELVEKP